MKTIRMIKRAVFWLWLLLLLCAFWANMAAHKWGFAALMYANLALWLYAWVRVEGRIEERGEYQAGDRR